MVTPGCSFLGPQRVWPAEPWGCGEGLSAPSGRLSKALGLASRDPLRQLPFPEQESSGEGRRGGGAAAGAAASRSPGRQHRGGRGRQPPAGPDGALGKSEGEERRPQGHRLPPRLAPPRRRSPVLSRAHLSAKLTCATRYRRRARASEAGRSSLQPLRPAGRPGQPELRLGRSVPPSPRPPTSCAAPREAAARGAPPGGRQVEVQAGRAQAGPLRPRRPAGGDDSTHLAAPPQSPPPPGRPFT